MDNVILTLVGIIVGIYVLLAFLSYIFGPDGGGYRGGNDDPF